MIGVMFAESNYMGENRIPVEKEPELADFQNGGFLLEDQVALSMDQLQDFHSKIIYLRMSTR